MARGQEITWKLRAGAEYSAACIRNQGERGISGGHLRLWDHVPLLAERQQVAVIVPGSLAWTIPSGVHLDGWMRGGGLGTGARAVRGAAVDNLEVLRTEVMGLGQKVKRGQRIPGEDQQSGEEPREQAGLSVAETTHSG